MEKNKKYISKSEALKKLQAYCAYQDRCHQEVRTKLLDLGVYGIDLEEIIVELIQEKFLNEERFACSFVRGKFRYKKWGKHKIQIELKRKNVSPYCIKKGMMEIEEEEYIATLNNLLQKKWKQLKKGKDYEKKQKTAQYVIRKGYESHLVWEQINKLFPK